MDKDKMELEETKKWIQERLVVIKTECDLNDKDNKEAYNSLKTALEIIENSIPKKKIEDKIEYLEIRKAECDDIESKIRLDVKINAYKELLKDK